MLPGEPLLELGRHDDDDDDDDDDEDGGDGDREGEVAGSVVRHDDSPGDSSAWISPALCRRRAVSFRAASAPEQYVSCTRPPFNGSTRSIGFVRPLRQ